MNNLVTCEKETIIRFFEYCPKCGKYIAPGFRTDMCPFCKHDFTNYLGYKERLLEDRKFLDL